MDKTINCDDFLSIFSEIDSFSLDKYWEKQLKLFMLQIDSKDFDYLSLKEALLEPVLSFAISRQKIKENWGKTMKISKEARNSFRDYLSNTGELWEILLYCLLESDLDAPKIISKLELKTSANDYVKWADGVHFKKIWDDYLIIFWESKTVKSIKTWIAKALQSIHDFKNGIQRDKDWNDSKRFRYLDFITWNVWEEIEKLKSTMKYSYRNGIPN